MFIIMFIFLGFFYTLLIMFGHLLKRNSITETH
jgi:hypothetical protein